MELVAGVNFLDYVWGKSRPKWEVYTAETVFDEHLSRKVTAPLPPPALPTINLQIDRLQAALKQLVEGLNALHEAGKLHRDIKPSNVLITDEGRVVILDFGLVTELTPLDTHQSITLAGTPAYMSPEQATGGRISEASDWYCVGVMLYEALTGRLPFAGQSRDVLQQKQIEEPIAPGDLASNIPAELDALCCDLLRRDPDRRPSGQEIILRLGEAQAPRYNSSQTPFSPARSSPFIGRKSHLVALDEAFLTSEAGQAVVVYVQGKSGIGKSTLVWQFLESAQAHDKEVVVLAGKCYEQESVPYKALDSLVDSLSRYLKKLNPLEAEAILPRDVLALARVFPVLKQVDAISRARRRVLATPDAQELRRRSFEAMRELLARLSDQKAVILFIDDLQWGDVDSADLLDGILHPPDPPPLLLILGFRSDEAETSPILRVLLPALKSTSGAEIRELSIDELSYSESRELAVTLLSQRQEATEDLIDVIIRESKGSPFFIGELTRYAQTEPGLMKYGGLGSNSNKGSDRGTVEISLDEMIHARITLLPEEARRTLEVIAVAGAPLEEQLGKQAAQIGTTEYPKVLALLRSNHLIRMRETQSGSEIETYHDRIREAVVSRLSPEVLKARHFVLAQTIEASAKADPETLAVHYEKAGNKERAVEYATLAADQAFEAFAFDRAARLYQLALELQSSRGAEHPIQLRLGDSLASAGRGVEAAQIYLGAVSGASAAEKIELQRRAAEQLLRSGHIDEGLAILQEMLKTMGIKIAKTPWRALLSVLARRAYFRFRGVRFKERDVTQLSAEELLRLDTCWSIGAGLGFVDVIRGRDFHIRHLLLALKAGEPQRIIRGLSGHAVAVSSSGIRSKPRAMKLLDEATRIAERLHHPESTGRVLLSAGFVAFFGFQWRKTIELTGQAEEILRSQCAGVSWELNMAHHLNVRALSYQGRWKDLARRLPMLIKEAHERGDRFTETSLKLRVAFILRLAEDEPAKVPEEIDHAIEGWLNRGFHVQHYWSLLARAETDIYCGNGLSAWGLISNHWSDMLRTLHLRVQLFWIDAVYLRGRSAIAAALDGATLGRHDLDPSRLLRLAEKDALKLIKEDVSLATGFGKLLQAGVATTRNDFDEAVELLLSAEKEFKTTDSLIYATVARRCRGELIGESEGDELIKSADNWMNTETIKNPARLSFMLAPGKWRRK